MKLYDEVQTYAQVMKLARTELSGAVAEIILGEEVYRRPDGRVRRRGGGLSNYGISWRGFGICLDWLVMQGCVFKCGNAYDSPTRFCAVRLGSTWVGTHADTLPVATARCAIMVARRAWPPLTAQDDRDAGYRRFDGEARRRHETARRVERLGKVDFPNGTPGG